MYRLLGLLAAATLVALLVQMTEPPPNWVEERPAAETSAP